MSELKIGSPLPDMTSYTRPPFELREELAGSVAALGLENNVAELRDEGYTVVRNVATPEFTQRLRSTCLRLAAETGFNRVAMLLGRDAIFEEVVTNPKILALAEVMCGRGALLSQLIAGIRFKGAAELKLHADQNWLPAPFPQHNQLFTMCWTMEEFTREGGATKVVPRTHVHRRHPTAAEIAAQSGAIPIECPASSLACWDGSIWHGNYPRTIDSERVVLHITFCRLALRPIENYDHLDETWLAGKSECLRTMLGRNDFLGKSGPAGWDEAKLPITFEWARN